MDITGSYINAWMCLKGPLYIIYYIRIVIHYGYAFSRCRCCDWV